MMGPCFFYTGNEGPLEEFYYNTGFPFDNAPDFGALIVFAEHRFYGGSRPFGDTPTREQFGLLSVEQALADYAIIVESLKAQYGFTCFCKSYQGVLPIIAIGGSYGGMLSAWFRMKYPHLVDMVCIHVPRLTPGSCCLGSPRHGLPADPAPGILRCRHQHICTSNSALPNCCTTSVCCSDPG